MCGGCGKKIWFWQKFEEHYLRANPVRRAMFNVPFHIGCYDKMENSAR